MVSNLTNISNSSRVVAWETRNEYPAPNPFHYYTYTHACVGVFIEQVITLYASFSVDVFVITIKHHEK